MEIAIHSLSVSRAHIAASNLGMCQRMLEISLARANDRITFGKPIASRQMIKREIAEMQMYTRPALHGLRLRPAKYDADPNGKNIEEKAAMCKLFSIYSTRIVSDGMLEIFGGDGYFEDSPYGPDRAPVPRRPRHVARGAPRPAHHHCPQLPEVRRQVSTSCNPPKGFDRRTNSLIKNRSIWSGSFYRQTKHHRTRSLNCMKRCASQSFPATIEQVPRSCTTSTAWIRYEKGRPTDERPFTWLAMHQTTAYKLSVLGIASLGATQSCENWINRSAAQLRYASLLYIMYIGWKS